MGFLVKVKSFVRVVRNGAKLSDVEVDPGGGAMITAEHMSSPGDDAFPLDTDYAAITEIKRTGGGVAAAYADPINDPVATEGEKRIYGRDPSNGAAVNQVWLKSSGDVLISNSNGSALLDATGGVLVTTPASTFDVKSDGSIKGNNGAGSFELTAAGVFLVNGVSIDTAGNISTPASVSSPSVLAAGKELAGHIHLAGTVPGNTGPNV